MEQSTHQTPDIQDDDNSFTLCTRNHCQLNCFPVESDLFVHTRGKINADKGREKKVYSERGKKETRQEDVLIRSQGKCYNVM